jgi:plastocyanin
MLLWSAIIVFFSMGGLLLTRSLQDANYTNSSANQYFFIPTTITIQEGQSITLSNLADYDLTFTSQPDTGLGNIILDSNEHQTLLFSDNGTYTRSCKQFPNEKFTVIVQGS